MFPVARTSIAAWLMFAALAAQAAEGLKAPPGESVWPRWQARVTLATTQPLWRPGAGLDERDGSGPRVESLGLLGDLYFGQSRATSAPASGFRATSGLIFGQPSYRALSGGSVARPGGLGMGGAGPTGFGGVPAAGLFGSDPATASTVPYFGLGYSSSPGRGGWGFTADIGLVAQSPAAMVRLGRVFSGTQSLDDMLREMRLAPLVNVGVSYSF